MGAHSWRDGIDRHTTYKPTKIYTFYTYARPAQTVYTNIRIYIFLLFSLLLPIKHQTAHLAKHSELRVREKRHHTHTVWGAMGNWVHFIKGGLLLFTSPSCLRYGIKSIARALNGFRVESNTKWNETCNVLFNHLPMLIP